MTLPRNWPTLTALKLGAMIEEGTLDPVTLTEAAIERISEHDPLGRIFIGGSETRALEEAIAAHDRAKKGLRRSPLDGVPLAWKDNIEAMGAPTTNGSKLLRHHVALRDADVIQRGVRAGLVTLGKTALTEFAFSGLGVNPTMGSPVNPFDPDTPRAPGGSSCGSAVAVATGLAPLAVGTDTAGSVRIPAAWNGLVGLKPTHGSIPLRGVLPLSRTMDTLGPLTRTVADAAALWAVLAGTKTPDLSRSGLTRVRFGVPAFADTEADTPVHEVFAAALSALETAGATIEALPAGPLESAQVLIDRYGTPVAAEGLAEWGELIESAPGDVFEFVRTRMEAGANATSGRDAFFILQALEDLRPSALSFMAGVDALLMPTTAILPPQLARIERGSAYNEANLSALRFTRIANMLNLTALTLPCGRGVARTGAQLPVGLMLMAGPGAEAHLLRLGAALEPHLPKIELPIS